MSHKGKFANKDYTLKNPEKYGGTKKHTTVARGN